MTALVLRAVLRSQRIVTTGLLTLAVAAIVSSNGPQSPGSTLGATALLLIPVHAWTAHAAARALDGPTRDVLVAASSARRLLLAQVRAAAGLGATSVAVVLLVAIAAQVMADAPSLTQWGAGALAALVGLAVGVAIGTVCGPPFVVTRGWQVIGSLLLLTLSVPLLPVFELSRALSDRSPSTVLAHAVGPGGACLAVAAVLLAGSWLTVERVA